MNKEQVQGNWEQFKGKVKQSWGKLTDDDIALLNGHREEFFGKVKENYGIAKEAAEKQLKDIETSCGYRYKN